MLNRPITPIFLIQILYLHYNKEFGILEVIFCRVS